MSKTLAILTSALVAGSLAIPVTVDAQARRRGGDSSDGSGSRAGSAQSGGTAQPRSAPAPRQSPQPQGERSSAPRSTAPRAGEGSRAPRAPEATGSVGRDGSRASAQSRARGAQAVRGTAQPRTFTPDPSRGTRYIYHRYPSYWGLPYGYAGYYDPWFYGSGYWSWSRYNAWHGPFLYEPLLYAQPYYWGSSAGSQRDRTRDAEPTGSLRLRVNPKEASVYVDGALAGIVDEFDGLSDHLRLPAGRHQIEFRAEGYEPLSRDVVVEAGKTLTERASLKRR